MHAAKRSSQRGSPLSFPKSLGTRSGIDYTIPQDIREVLGDGDFLWRLYPDPNGAPDVDLFVAYFASQRAGDTLHSPKNCLPGDGWFPIRSGEQEINVPGVAPFGPMNTLSPRIPRDGWCSTGTNRTTVLWPMSIGPSFTKWRRHSLQPQRRLSHSNHNPSRSRRTQLRVPASD